MLDFLTPTFLLSAGIPTALAIAVYIDSRRKEPKERQKLDLEIQAARSAAVSHDAQATEALLASVNQVTRLLSDVKDQVADQILTELVELRNALEKRLDKLEERLADVESRKVS